MLKFVVGGPWYHGQIDSRLMITIVRLTVYAPDFGAHVVKVASDDGMIDVTRNRLMETALRTGAEWFLSLDADCSLPAPIQAIAAMEAARHQDVALVGFPARETNGRWNVVSLERTRLEVVPRSQFDAGRVGFGAVAFRLGWYVQNWPRDLAYFHSLPERGPDGRWGSISEDFGHADQVRRLGGRVLVDGRVDVEHHMGRAGAFEAQP